jgi:hypothetical protein
MDIMVFLPTDDAKVLITQFIRSSKGRLKKWQGTPPPMMFVGSWRFHEQKIIVTHVAVKSWLLAALYKFL